MSSTHPLAGVVEKLRNADEHFQRLEATLLEYLGGTLKGTVRSEFDPNDSTRGLLRFMVLQQPPLKVAAIVGDVVHNLRCSLDYMVEELVKRNGHTPGFQHQFPICIAPGAFVQALKKGRLYGVHESAVRAIDRCQPYHADPDMRERHALNWLHMLSNRDKHHMLAVSALNAGLGWAFVAHGGHTLSEGHTTERVGDGGTLASVPVEFIIDGKKVQLQSKLSIGVSFAEPEFKNFDVMGSLQTIREHIGLTMLPRFTEFFDPLPEQLRLTSHGILSTPTVEMLLLARPNSQRPSDNS